MAQEKTRKSLDTLIRENNEHRKLLHKTFTHKADNEKYQLLSFAFDTNGNNIHVIYCLVAFPAIKYVDPLQVFLDQFEPLAVDHRTVG